jgi:hypothetical protein
MKWMTLDDAIQQFQTFTESELFVALTLCQNWPGAENQRPVLLVDGWQRVQAIPGSTQHEAQWMWEIVELIELMRADLDLTEFVYGLVNDWEGSAGELILAARACGLQPPGGPGNRRQGQPG